MHHLEDEPIVGGEYGKELAPQHCARHEIGFIPWYPLGAGDLSRGGTALQAVARRLGATPHQVALAWALRRSPVMLPIPGTSKVAHLEENAAAGRLELSEADMTALSDLPGTA